MSVEAQARRGAGRAVSPRGRSSFGSGYGLRYDGGWGWGWRWVGNWVYPDVYVSPEVNDYVIWPPPAYIAPTTPRAGTTGRLVYDSSGKPIGVILRNSDGSKEFVPVST